MSNLEDPLAAPCDTPGTCPSIRYLIRPRAKDLGEFSVRRVLPAAAQRMVGPFVFFDHMGPAEFAPGQGIQVRPHPHIGIATITYLFDGEILHRDSLGYEQPIQPAAVNLMTAGRGIVHSERAGSDLEVSSRLHGIQSWIALPVEQQEREPAFMHYPADALPEQVENGVSVRLIMGNFGDLRSPVTSYSPTLYAELQFEAGAEIALPSHVEERALYVVEGALRSAETRIAAAEMAVFEPGETVVRATEAARVMLIGGDAIGSRHLWWNFVSDDPARIELAKRDWQAGRFGTVAGDDEFIPLPE
ncbi:MAG: pirin family protein [Pseudomonadota bacterium]